MSSKVYMYMFCLDRCFPILVLEYHQPTDFYVFSAPKNCGTRIEKQ